MKPIRSTLIATLCVASLSGVAFAQSGNPATDNPRAGRLENMRQHHAERHAERHAARWAELKTKLNLQAAQEPAWNRFVQSMQQPARTARPERARLETMTTPERLDQMQAMKAERDARMQQRTEATRALYAGLNADQKQVFDQETARAMAGRGMHGMGHAGHHGHR